MTQYPHFFDSFPGFEHSEQQSFEAEFTRLVTYHRSRRRRFAYKSMRRQALQSETNRHFLNKYGTRLEGWQALCREGRIEPQASIKKCREAVEEANVNILDLIDSKRQGVPMRRSVNIREFDMGGDSEDEFDGTLHADIEYETSGSIATEPVGPGIRIRGRGRNVSPNEESEDQAPAPVSFFALFADFVPIEASRFNDEFDRLASSQDWRPGTQEHKVQYTRATVHEVRYHYFSQGTRLDGFRNLCREIGIEPQPSIKKCKRALGNEVVNFVDLIDTRRIGSEVKVWTGDFEGFCDYMVKSGRLIDKELAKEEGFAATLLKKLPRRYMKQLKSSARNGTASFRGVQTSVQPMKARSRNVRVKRERMETTVQSMRALTAKSRVQKRRARKDNSGLKRHGPAKDLASRILK